MNKYSQDEIRKKIIGLGDDSVKKSYYPQLQDKIKDLQDKQKLLMQTVRALEERETELESLLAEKEALLHEVNHRVKNNLQIITSLLNMSSEAPAEFVVQAFHNSMKRVETIAMVYQDFVFSDSFTEISLMGFIRILAVNIRSDKFRHDVEINMSMPDEAIIISIDTAIPLVLILNEVITNSFDYAFSGGSGRLSISVCASGRQGKNRKITIGDSGPLLPAGSLTGKPGSLGMRLIEALAGQMDAEYSYTNDADGTRFEIDFHD